MKKFFQKLNEWRFLRNTSLHYPLILLKNNRNLLYKKALAITLKFPILLCNNIKQATYLKHKMYDTDLNEKYLVPPEAVRGMKNLDRNAFTKNIQVPYLAIASDKIAPVLKTVKPYVLKLKNFRPLQETENAGLKHIYLNPDSVRCFDDFKDNKIKVLIKEGVNQKDFFWRSINICYDNWSSDIILKSILPVNQSGISGYSIIGHIMHLNLKDHLLEYKSVIGQVLRDKIPNVRTVVNKTNTIDSKYRNFSMEVLSGDDDMNVCVKENGCSYKFDFSKVYWNPRLCTEHNRIASKFQQGDILFDVFAGVGPFAIPIAKKKCTVIANDLNPNSFHWLCSNAALNKVTSYIETFNMDGRDFICQVVRSRMLKIWEEKTLQTIHIVMNLPATAVKFLDAFKGLGNGASESSEKLPIVHCYCFVTGDDYKELAQKSVESHLDCKLETDLEVVYVRNVSPNKEMVRVSFRIPRNVLFTDSKILDEPLVKKPRLCDVPHP